jgi:hypothetical protein
MSWSTSAKGDPSEVAARVDANLAAAQANYEKTAAKGLGVEGVDQDWAKAAAEEAKDVAAARDRISVTIANLKTEPGYEHVEVSAYGSRSPGATTISVSVTLIPAQQINAG